MTEHTNDSQSVEQTQANGRQLAQVRAGDESAETVLRALLGNLPVGVLVEDGDRNIRAVNAAFLDIFQRSGSGGDLIGRDCAAAAEDLGHLFTDPDGFTDGIEAILEDQTVTNDELDLADGRTVERTYVPYTVDGRPANLWLYRDITERKTRREAFYETKRRLQLALEGSETGIWEWEIDSDEVTWDETIERQVGLDPGAFGGTFDDFFNRVHADDRARVQEAIGRALENDEPYETEFRLVHENGHTIWVEVRGQLLQGEGGNDRMLGIHHEITERKEYEQALEETNARYQALTDYALDTSEVATCILDSDLRVGWVNHAFQEYFGVDRAGITGEYKPELVRERLKYNFEDPDGFSEKVLSAYRDNTYTEEFDCHVPPDGERAERWLEHWSHPIESGLYAGGRVEHYTDITERVQRAQRREQHIDALDEFYRITTDSESEFAEKLTEVLELGVDYLGVPYGFVTRIDRDGDAEEATQTVVDAVGTHDRLQPGESCPLSEAYCRKTIHQDGLLAVHDAVTEGWEGDPAYETFDLGSYIGGTIYVDGELYGTFCFAGTDHRVSEFLDEHETFVRFAAEWAGYELERHEHNASLERTNERLEEFARVLSHDLRNPLNVAEGRLALAQSERESEHLDEIDDALSRIDALIEDLLQRARHGGEVVETEPLSLQTVAEECWGNVDTADATLTVETDRTVSADPKRVQQILTNLVRNAVEHGGRDVTVTIGALDDGFYVEDDGPGIPEADREQVFESLYSTAESGTGLGLSIVRDLVQNHGWAVTVTDGSEGGARFEITAVDFV